MLSFSKGALLLGLPASLGVVGLFWIGGLSGRLRRGWLWAILGGLAAGGAGAFALLLRLPRFANLFDLTSGTSFFRLRLWGSALAMIRDHPWLGVGPDNFLYAYRGQYINPEAWQEPNLSHAHNFALDFAARLGLPGLGAFLWMQVAFFRQAFALAGPAASPEGLARRALAIGLLASMIDFLAHGLVDASFFFVDLAFVFFLTLGLVARLREIR